MLFQLYVMPVTVVTKWKELDKRFEGVSTLLILDECFETNYI